MVRDELPVGESASVGDQAGSGPQDTREAEFVRAGGMSEDARFFKQAAEAIIGTSLNVSAVDPAIRELLNRLKYVNPDSQDIRHRHQGSEAKVSDIASTQHEPNAEVQKYSHASMPENYTTDPEVHKSNSKSGNGAQSTDRNFHCAKCNLVFRRSSDLRRHERQHLPVLPHICSQCGKAFARKDALKRHFNTLTCQRNRNKLLSIGGDINVILERARKNSKIAADTNTKK